MPLQYYLMPNVITPDPDDYMAVTVNGKTYTIEDVYDAMTHEGSTITKAEALAAFEEIVRAIIRLVSDGNSVTTSLVNISARIVGVFTGEDDRFDASRHQVKLRVQPGIRLGESESAIKTEKVQPKERLPVLLHYEDNGTESKDSVATASGGARLTGSLLKFDEADAAQGIFFIDTNTGTETKVTGKLMRNKPGELIFMNPKLPKGTYRVEVRAVVKGKKGLVTGALPDQVTVS